MPSFILENAMKPDCEKEMIIDLGYLKNKETQDRHQKLLAFGIGHRNFCCDITARLTLKCPKTKVKALLETFPVKEGCRYWQTTHHWLDD